MKFIHLSDLHIGKKVNEFSMIEDQEYIFAKIINIIDAEEVEGVLIAGDVYDKSLPSAEALGLFDDFLTKLAGRNIPIFIISGNHDSAERIAFGARLLNSSGVYLSPVFNGRITPVTLDDEYGEIDVYMLPFIKPAYVKKYHEEAKLDSYNDAVKYMINQLVMDPQKRNILIAHQFVTGAKRCESEDSSVGGVDNIDAGLFNDFDYVALGHLHNPQHIMRDTVRYCGTPLKYSFSEANHEKSVTVVTLKKKGHIEIKLIPLVPLKNMAEIKGSYMEVTALDFHKSINTDDYLHITLTDENDIPDAIGKLRAIYPNIMKLDYENQRTGMNLAIDGAENVEQKTPLALIAEFYELQNNQPLSEEQKALAAEIMERIREEKA